MSLEMVLKNYSYIEFLRIFHLSLFASKVTGLTPFVEIKCIYIHSPPFSPLKPGLVNCRFIENPHTRWIYVNTSSFHSPKLNFTFNHPLCASFSFFSSSSSTHFRTVDDTLRTPSFIHPNYVFWATINWAHPSTSLSLKTPMTCL